MGIFIFQSQHIDDLEFYKEKAFPRHCYHPRHHSDIPIQKDITMNKKHPSHLSASQYGYDFVLSTTQASINANLLNYLNDSDQPEQYICYLADPATGNPIEEIALKDLIKKSGYNPFEVDIKCKKDTAETKQAIQALTAQRFVVGIRIKIGLPPDVELSKLPPVVTLGDDVKQVRFNMLCADFTVIQNSPPNGFGGTGRWDVWTQPDGDVWSVGTNVNLKIADLDNELNTPYFQKHPQEKQAILDKLENLSGTAFSLQQLLFDLDNASLQSNLIFGGIQPGSNVHAILQKSFISLWAAAAAEKGQPLLSIIAVDQSTDPSQLLLTGFERAINPPRDDNGNKISTPTQKQMDAGTLDHLCAANHNALPQASPFKWNWLLPDQTENISGVITINRGTYAMFLKDQLLPEIKRTCFKPSVTVWNTVGASHFTIGLSSGDSPQTVKVTDSGDNIIHIEYSKKSGDSSSKWAMYAESDVTSSYTCDVFVNLTSITVKQHLKIYVWLKWDLTTAHANVVDKTITDNYDVTVTQAGALSFTQKGATKTEDKSQSGSLDGFSNWFVSLNDVIDHIKSYANELDTLYDKSIGFDNLQSFVFPGSKVFTFKSPQFSSYQDLVCPITYVDVSDPPGRGRYRTRTRYSLEEDIPGERFNLTSSTDLVENYLQGHLVSPTGKFETLQTANGHGLVFSTDDRGVFQVIQEQLQSTAGWAVSDLSTTAIHGHFPGKTDAQVSTFDVGQSVVDGSISLAMAVRSDNSDSLFVSLGNSNSNTRWIQSPSWTQVPFDAESTGFTTQITIRGILFAEAIGSKEYLVVDIDRASKAAAKEIERYHVDMTKANGHYWVKHDVPVDISSVDYQSCIGRVKKGRVDGVYTSGQIAGSPQLFYVPIVNVYGPAPPAPRRLQLPNNAAPSAIASARNGLDTAAGLHATTDLYVTSGSKLYWFAADKQSDSSFGTLLLDDDVFSETTTLIAMTHDGVTTIWGKNGNDSVYYLSCPTTQIALPGSWSVPVPILTGIEHLSAYVNRADGGKTVFASGGSNLFKIEQASLTGSKLWKPQKITLGAHREQKAIPYKSYTSTLQVTDENDLPAGKATVNISTTARTPVFINGLYYVLSQMPVRVMTDDTGSVTVVEATEDINAAILTVSVNGGSPQQVNPMSKSFDKLTALDSEHALRGATVPDNIKSGGVVGPVQPVPIVNQSNSSQDLQTVAAGLKNLKDVHTAAQSQPGSCLDSFNKGVIPATLFHSSGSANGGDGIAIAIGDLFQWLKTGVEHVIEIIKDAATDTWHFIAKVAGNVYRAILDTVEAVVGAIEWVFNAIKTAIKDLIRFVQFLFEWDDIRRTKDVMSNIARLYIRAQIDTLPVAKKMFNAEIDSLKKTLDQWAGIDTSSLGNAVSKPASSSASNPAKGQTSGSQLLAHHFRNNAGNLTVQGDKHTLDGVGDVVQDVIDDLLGALSKEGKVLSGTYTQLQNLAKGFHSMSVADVLKQLIAILGDTVLDSTRVVVDVLMDVLYHLAQSAIDLIDTKIHIPVISDILNAIGVPDISFLDLLTWIAAVGFTVVYKIAEGHAPFPDSNDTKSITSATSWSELSALFGQSSELLSSTSKDPAFDPSKLLPESVCEVFFITGHATAGFIVLMGDFLNVFEAEALTGDNPFSFNAAFAGLLAAGFQGVTDVLVPKYSVENKVVKAISIATLTCTITAKLVFWGPLLNKLAAKCSWFAVADGRATGAIVNSILVIPALCVSGWHFYELGQKPAGAERSAAIVGEVSNLTSYISRISYATAVNDTEEISRNVAIGVMATSNVATAGLQTAEAFLSRKSAAR